MIDRRALGYVLAATLLLGGLAGCDPRGAPAASDGAVVDSSLLAYLSLARALHREADLAERDDDPQKAVEAMDRLFRAPRPGPSPEVDEVLADSHARMAELLAGLGEFDRAEHQVGEGLTLAKEPTFFRGRLLEVRGLVEEKRAKALRTAGDVEAAKAAERRAVAASEEAIQILQRVIEEKAPKPGGPR